MTTPSTSAQGCWKLCQHAPTYDAGLCCGHPDDCTFVSPSSLASDATPAPTSGSEAEPVDPHKAFEARHKGLNLDRMEGHFSGYRDAHTDARWLGWKACWSHVEALTYALEQVRGPLSTAALVARAEKAEALAKPASSPAGGDVDEIMTRIYRRFKDWSERKFSADDVTWCEVKADVLGIIAALSPSTSAAEPVACGPFGHHPDPSTDFCVEVETLEGWAEDVKAGTRSQWPFWGRLSALLRFVRSDEFAELDEIAQRAKATVFELEGRVTGVPPAPAAVDGQRVKALEWRAIERARSDEDPSTDETGDYEATSPFGEYFIECGFGSDSYVWSVSFCGDFVIAEDDPEAAKAAAQADYEARILSALVSGSREDGADG